MKYKLSLVFLIVFLTACSNTEEIDLDTISTNQKKQLVFSDELLQSEEKSTKKGQLDSFQSEKRATPALDTDKIDNTECAKVSSLQKLLDEIEAQWNGEQQKEVPASRFADMDYLFLIQEEVDHFDDGGTPWYEYAILGSSYDTYAKGIDCYEKVNLFFEKWQVDKDFNELKEKFGEGFIKQYYRRHIVAFSPYAERILLKTYIHPPYDIRALYEVYEYGRGCKPYIYIDTVNPESVNYTKGIQFATLSTELYANGTTNTFYSIYDLSMESIQEAKQYDITLITDPNDKFYYKKDINSQGKKCICIYTITDNQLIYQSDSIEEYPGIVDILDNKLMIGFLTNTYNYSYIEINMETNDIKYLFSSKERGSFSPDGKYFAYPDYNKEDRGYRIYCVATGESVFIKSYGRDTEPPEYLHSNKVCCWVKKEKIEELKKIG